MASLDRQLAPSEFARVVDANTGETITYAYRSVVRTAMSTAQKTEWIERVRSAGARLGFTYANLAYHQVIPRGEPHEEKYAANVRIVLSRNLMTQNVLDALREAIPTGIVTMVNGLFGIGMRAPTPVTDIAQQGGPYITTGASDSTLLSPEQAVRELQRRLQITQTGAYDAATREAMTRFQRIHQNEMGPMNVNGEPNLATLHMLGLNNPSTATWYERLTSASRTRNGGGGRSTPERREDRVPKARGIPWGMIALGAGVIVVGAVVASRSQ